jgi:hypothetical protein
VIDLHKWLPTSKWVEHPALVLDFTDVFVQEVGKVSRQTKHIRIQVKFRLRVYKCRGSVNGAESEMRVNQK